MTKREKPVGRQWKLLDITIFTMMAALVILFMLIFTTLGDSLAAAGQRELDAAIRADPTSAGEQCLKPKAPILKLESPFWILIVDCSNFQNMFLLNMVSSFYWQSLVLSLKLQNDLLQIRLVNLAIRGYICIVHFV